MNVCRYNCIWWKARDMKISAVYKYTRTIAFMYMCMHDWCISATCVIWCNKNFFSRNICLYAMWQVCNVCIHADTSRNIYLCTMWCAHICICMYVCMYIYIYIHLRVFTHAFKQKLFSHAFIHTYIQTGAKALAERGNSTQRVCSD